MISTLQTRIKTLLESHSWFAGIDVLTEEKGDIGYQIDAAINRIGLSVAVIIPTASPIKASSHERIDIDVAIGVAISELHTTNETGKRARDGIEPAIAALHSQWNGLGPEPSALRPSSIHRLMFTRWSVEPDEAVTTYIAEFTTQYHYELTGIFKG